ncbi:MAG: hypothetical protein GXO47_01275 [Chlorobi bacterium]|nr:hypothetical protein [Chlorobiota bacterium]
MSNRFINVKTVHIFSWMLYLIFMILFFSNLLIFRKAVFKAVELTVIHSAIFYFNLIVLIPRLLEKQKYITYALSVIVLMLVSSGLILYIDIYLKPFGDVVMRGPGINQMLSPEMQNAFNLQKQPGILLIKRSLVRNLTSLLAIVLASIVYKMIYQKVSEEKKKAEIRSENLLSEMKFLKSQVNPHFLFNALNNIYALVLLKKENAPAMLMKLSEMLRYMLYECNDDFVPIGKEVLYINNFIELQKLKTEYSQNIEIDFSEIDKSTPVPPLLFIPFIENSFKHSGITDTGNGWIRLKLKAMDNKILFNISNSIPSIKLSKDKTQGIGLENVKRRLELLYKGKHELEIKDTGTEFIVDLKIYN